LQDALGGVRSVYLLPLNACFEAMAPSLRRELPEYGRDVAFGGTDGSGCRLGETLTMPVSTPTL
jgi:hypothetical protein